MKQKKKGHWGQMDQNSNNLYDDIYYLWHYPQIIQLLWALLLFLISENNAFTLILLVECSVSDKLCSLLHVLINPHNILWGR